MAKKVRVENERRRHPRLRGVILEYDVIRVINGKTEIQLKAAMIRDISLGGVSMFVAQEISPGERIVIKLYSDMGQAVVAVGTVIWCQRADLPHKDKDFYHIGIEFLELDKKNLRALERMIQLFNTLDNKDDSGIRKLF